MNKIAIFIRSILCRCEEINPTPLLYSDGNGVRRVYICPKCGKIYYMRDAYKKSNILDNIKSIL